MVDEDEEEEEVLGYLDLTGERGDESGGVSMLSDMFGRVERVAACDAIFYDECERFRC